MLKKALKPSLIVSILLLIGFITRFLYLGSIPVGLTHDDADVVGSIKTLAESGVDVSGVSFPTLLFFNKTQGNISGLASFLLSPVFKLFDLNLFSIHFVFVLINLASLIALSLLVFKLTKKHKLSTFVFLIGLFNPWFFAYSRYPTEAPVALLFTLVALLFFHTKHEYSLLLSSIFFVLSFYSYYGAKISAVLLFPVLCFLSLVKDNFNLTNFKKFILPLILFVVTVLSYFWISFFSTSSTLSKRLGNEFIFRNLETFEHQTDEYRKISIESPVTNLFYNKYVFLGEAIVKKYIGWMSPNILFFEGDPVSVYRFSDHGLFLYLDIILFIFGLAYFTKNLDKSKAIILICLVLIIIGPVGSSISNMGTSYFFRSFLLLPPLLILLGSGMYYLESVLVRLNLRAVWYLFVTLYLLLFFRFCFFYFARYPVYSQENNYLAERILSSYIDREIKQGKDITLYISNTESFKNLNILYAGSLNPSFNLTNDCNDNYNNDLKIYDASLGCESLSGDDYVIVNQKDSGHIFKILNGNICDGSFLTAYRRNHLISDYSIEKMTDQEFCNRWIQNGKTE